MECPEAEALVALASGDLPAERRAELANHAAGCAPCFAAIDALLRPHGEEEPADAMASTQEAARARDEPVAPSEDARPPQRRRPTTGDRVDRYVIDAVLGRGGMGVVYRARDPELGRSVAIKVLRRGAGGGERLRREAQALAKLSHPNVVTVYDVGTHDGQPFIAMALIEGDTLRHWLTTPRPPEAVLQVLLAAGRGLAAAHEVGLIHRDLKPDNIFVSRTGQVLVGDFGLVRGIASGEHATVHESGDDADDGEIEPPLTRTGVLLGTPAYMAPEQAAGGATTASDQFSFCVTAWEAFTGARPFAGATPAELLASIRGGAVIEPADGRALPPRIDAALRRGLAADPARRFPSMNALLAALDPGGEHAPALAPETARPLVRRARWTAAVAIVTAGAAAWAASRALRGRTSPPEPAPAPVIAGMVWFPGGTFRMGRTAAELETECARLGAACRRHLLDREQPARQVTLSPFYLDELEATNEDVARWLTTMKPSLEMRMDDERKVPRWVYLDGLRLIDLLPPHAGIARGTDGGFVARPGREREPASQLTWDGASLYCKGRDKRLPTEAEWEHAARGRTARRFPWGEREPGCDEVVWGRDTGKPCAGRSGAPGPLAVGTAPLDRTPEGVRDLGGNVTEWVQDQFTKPYLPECGACVDPRIEEPVPLQEDVRVLRGGSWVHGWHMSRSTMRTRWKRTEVAPNAGVRCASR